ncbi:hypothetical protein PIB30_081701 [Stylosanthes scabra]|uniref:Disease resistance N-terminal domain-containing protein n=1 Tax=Stylosanthes scabra TaxID=79078 RepID=A0ABU6QT10_9FABA|nr:hypothetical protein [Stylosanthes scabra]
MPKQIPFGVATSLINTIASSAFREIGRICEVMDDIEKLKDTMEYTKVVLSDAELKQGQDATVADWVKRFQQVLYDVDDLLDDVFIKDLRRKASFGTEKTRKVRDFLSISNNSIDFRAKLARKIENIRKNFNEIAEDMSKLNPSRSVVIRKTALSQLVYNAAQDQDLFQKYMWVWVSEDFELKTILKKMLLSLKKDSDGDSLEALQQKL